MGGDRVGTSRIDQFRGKLLLTNKEQKDVIMKDKAVKHRVDSGNVDPSGNMDS